MEIKINCEKLCGVPEDRMKASFKKFARMVASTKMQDEDIVEMHIYLPERIRTLLRMAGSLEKKTLGEVVEAALLAYIDKEE